MRDEKNRRSPATLFVERSGDRQLRGGVEALRRLVEQQQPRPDKQGLRFRKQLLLAAAQIGRMTPAQTVKAEPLRHGLRLGLPVPRRNTPLHELFAHGIAREERARVLRHERLGCAQRVTDAPTFGRQSARHQAQQGRLPAAVASHDSVHRTAGDRKGSARQHPGLFAAETETDFAHVDGRSGLSARESGSMIAFGAVFLLQAAFRMPTEPGNLQRFHAAFAHADRLGRVGRHRLWRMRRHDHRDAAFAVHAEERMQEILRRNRIELGGRFVQKQYARLQNERRRQVEQLLLAARQACGLLPEPRLDAEKVRNLCHPAAHGADRRPQVLKAECQLVPYRVADDLAFGTLGHEAYQQAEPVVFATPANGTLRCTLREKRLAERAHAARPRANGSYLGLRAAQKRAFPGSRRAHEQHERSFAHRPVDTTQHRFVRARVGKGKVAKRQRLHLSASSPWTMNGYSRNTAHAP